MRIRLGALFFLTALIVPRLSSEPVTTDSSNPHYYSFHGRPILLITSAEHYGGVINKAFNYVVYFDSLKANGLTYTRIYPGALFEPMGKFMTGNTLGPKMWDLIEPWARSDQPGYLFGGNRFDLDRWNSEYFARLKDFIKEAGKREIVVEICLFNSQYSDTWPLSPLNSENNIQGVGDCDWRDAQTLKHADLVRREENYVRKIVQEVNSFDNVILEVCDEPSSIGTGIALAGPWVGHMIDVVRNTERQLPQKHLLAQEVEGPFGGAMDYSADPRVSIIVAQYIWGREPGASGGEMGGMRGLDYKYNDNKPIEMNETDYYPLNYRGDKIADSRVEAWEFIVGGGAGFNQLNGLYTAKNPSGQTADDQKIWLGLRSLKSFMYSFHFTEMSPDKDFISGGVPSGAYCRTISQRGKQYAAYLHHSGERSRGSYEAVPGDYQETLRLNLPAGQYLAEWVNPADGTVSDSHKINHGGGICSLTTPKYSVDIALRIKSAQ
jgi:hypothetical protein